MRFLITNIETAGSSFCSEKIWKHKSGVWNFFSSDEIVESKYSNYQGFVSGYIRDFNLNQDDLNNNSYNTFNQIFNTWPLPENITGSFSVAVINSKTEEVVICNDLLGVYPIYYLRANGNFFISNSLIWIGRISGCEKDETGIAQRCFGPDYCNFGRRTILKNCKSLLPGEWIKFGGDAQELQKKYNNSLYQEADQIGNPLKKMDGYWDTLTKEVAYCLNHQPKVNLALSGGMDSRILLGAIPPEKEIFCYTYGKNENYETKVAQRVAKIKQANFRNFSDPWLNFPNYNLLQKYTLQTEGIYLCSWIEILENVGKAYNEPFLIGDLSTAISGRTIKKFSTKDYRTKNYFKHSIFEQDYELELTTSENWEAWKNKILNSYLNNYNKKNIAKLDLNISVEEIRSNVTSDLLELFSRIENHQIKYIDLIDELFTWYTHTRFPMGKQILINNYKFNALCPALSTAVLRYASNIHPSLRLNQKFIRLLFKEKEELKLLSKIPTSQIPILPLNFPDVVRFPLWAARSKMDEYLIKRLIKAKDPTLRYRVFNSNNWVEVYQNPELEKNLKSYFKKNHLGKEYIKDVISLAKQRRDLNQWPFANMDIMNAAALNTELELIASYNEGI